MPTRSGRRYTTGEVITPELIPGLPNDVVLTHVLPHVLETTIERARMCMISRAMKDAVSELWWRLLEENPGEDMSLSEEDGLQWQYEAWIAAGEPDDERRWYVYHGEVDCFV